MVKSWKKVGKSGEKLEKVGQSDEKLEKVGNFFHKMAGAAILDDLKSLSITFLAISDQYAAFLFFYFFLQNGRRLSFWMTENHFRSHFSPFQINTQL